MTKIFVAILIFLTVWLQYRVWFGENGQQQLASLQIKIEQQKKQNKILATQNEKLKREIFILRHKPEALEEKAREQLGLIKQGEIFYRIIPSENNE